MTDRDLHAAGIAVALIFHLALVGGGWALSRGGDDEKEKSREPEQYIEAGLAIQAKTSAGKKSKQPQKEYTHKVKPTDVTVTRNDKATEQKKKPDDENVPPEHQDAKSVFEKYRNLNTEDPDEQPDPTQTEPGADDENKEGQADGSDRGTLLQAKGDPYLGDLVGRMGEHFEIADFPRDQGELSAWGCVKLDADGNIVDYKLEERHRSSNPGFNSAVEEALRKAKANQGEPDPVPDRLKDMLVGKFVCAKFEN